MPRTLGHADRGKRVVTTDGAVIGVVARIDADGAWVEPTPGLLAGLGSWLTGSLEDVECFRLQPACVRRIDGDEVHVAPTDDQREPHLTASA